VTSERRRPIAAGAALALGALLLGVSFRTEPGGTWFYPAALALAAVWTVGAFASGPVPRGEVVVLRPVAVGVGLGGVFVLGALVVREIAPLEHQVADVTAYADRGSGPAVVAVALLTGAAEELFFRGALYDVVGAQPVLGTTLAYTLVTLATGNVALVLAAAVLAVVVGLERRASGGVLAPVLTHLTWSAVLLVALPALF
jgi:hypothetical protein